MKARFFSITRIVLGNWKPLPLIFNMRKQTLPEAKRLTFEVRTRLGWHSSEIYHATPRSPHIIAGLRVGPHSQRTTAAQNLRGLIEFTIVAICPSHIFAVL
jgi:hypothetical protein